MVKLMLVSVSPACVFPLLPLSFCFGLFPLLLTLLVAPVIEMEGTKTMMKCWFSGCVCLCFFALCIFPLFSGFRFFCSSVFFVFSLLSVCDIFSFYKTKIDDNGRPHKCPVSDLLNTFK